MPGIQGGPLMHIIAAKAVAYKQALEPSFKIYCQQVIDNAKTIANEMKSKGYDLVSDGTDTHLVLIDLSSISVSGKKAEKSLESAGITVNKNMVPFDTKSPMVTSGIRIGTPAMTTRGMKNNEMKIIVNFIDKVLKNPDDEQLLIDIKNNVKDFCSKFPLYED